MSHSLFDGPAAHDFLYAWASNSLIVEGKGRLEQQQPLHERGSTVLLSVTNCSAPNVNTTKLSKKSSSITKRAAAIDHLYQLIMQAATDQSLSDLDSNQNSYILRTFHLSSTMIESLKSKVSGKRGGSSSCSSFEVVAAHLWKVSFSIEIKIFDIFTSTDLNHKSSF